MKNSEILKEAWADIEDVEHWQSGGWADKNQVTGRDEFLALGRVCALTSVARVSLRHDLTGLNLNNHRCNCPDCVPTPDEVGDVMSNFEHPALDLLNQAARRLYERDIPEVNDDLGHEQVQACYTLAIEMAEAEEVTA